MSPNSTLNLKVAALIPAAGRGKRLGLKRPKVFLSVNGKPMLVHTLERLIGAFPFVETVVAVDAASVKSTNAILKRHGLSRVRVVRGGRTRSESVKRALGALNAGADWVLVHDAARPLVSRAVVRRTIEAALKTGAAICAVPATATVKRIDPRTMTVTGTERRETLVFAQTPQVFLKTLIQTRYRALGARALGCTDDAALFDGSRTRVRVTPGEVSNIKVTMPGDLKLFRRYLSGRKGGT